MNEFYEDLMCPVVYRWVKNHEGVKICHNKCCTLWIDNGDIYGVIEFHDENIVEMCIRDRYKNPLSRLQIFGQGILQAMQATGQLESLHCIVKTELMGIYHVVYLAGGTGHDKTLFAKCVYEFFGEIDNQRYILYKSRKKRKMEGYFVIPEIFAKRRLLKE